VRWNRLAQRGKVAFAIALISQILFGRRPQLVFCGHLNLLPFALLAAKHFGSPLLAYLHGIEAWAPPRRALVRKRASRADRYIAVSEVTRDRFVEWSGADKLKVAVIPNAVHIDGFGMGPRNPELVRRYGLEGKRVLMTMCRLDARQRHKGVDEVIEILPQLLERHDDLVFVVVGDGDDLQRLKARASGRGLAGHVVFTGWIDEGEKADHLRLADAFTLAGHGDGFGIVLLEAMACGIPVVASSLDGSSETVLGGRLGQVADPRNEESLANAILRALELPRRVPPELAEFSLEAYCKRLSEVVLPMMGPMQAKS
jgi:phosphatidylinositol alpha-1,6-mannosyltransferase